MTRDEILHLAEQVGCGWARNGTEPVLIHGEKIVAFAARVASAEREACSKVCENLVTPKRPIRNDPGRAWLAGTLDCAEAIRARDDA